MTMSIGPGFLQPRVCCWGTMVGLRVTIGILGQVWCLIVSIPDLCPLSYIHCMGADWCTYQDIAAAIVWVVRQSLLQHLWYLTEHLVIPAFFMSLRFLVWRKLWLHKLICILQCQSMLSRSHERSMGMLPLSMLSIWFSSGWLVISKITLWCLWIPITLYLLEQYSIPLKPVLVGMRIVALSISSHEQTQ